MRLFIILSMVALMSCACASTPEAVIPQEATPVAINTIRGEWVLQQMNGEPLSELTVSLDIRDNQISGVSFCNNYNATITVDGSSFVVNPAISATRMMCPEGDTMQQEQMYFEALTKVKTFADVDGRLELRDETGMSVLVYKR